MPIAPDWRSISSSRTPCMDTRPNSAFTVVISARTSYAPERRTRSSANAESLPPLQNATAGCMRQIALCVLVVVFILIGGVGQHLERQHDRRRRILDKRANLNGLRSG